MLITPSGGTPSSSWPEEGTRLGVLVEALAGSPPELAGVDVALENRPLLLEVVRHHHLPEQRVHDAGHLLVLVDDVQGRGKANDVEDLERSVRRTGADGPGLVDALGVGDAVGIEVQTREEKRDEHGVEEVTCLLLVHRQGNHANLLRELHDLVERLVACLVLDHDLGNVHLPDGVGEVHREVAVGTACVARELRGQQRRGVGDHDGLLGHERRKPVEERGLLIGDLGHGLDDEIGIRYGLCHVKLELETFVGLVDLLDAYSGIEGAELRDSLAPGGIGGALGRLHALDGAEIGCLELVDLGLATTDGALAAQPDRHIEAAIRRLKRDLRTEDAAAGNDHLLDVGHSSLPAWIFLSSLSNNMKAYSSPAKNAPHAVGSLLGLKMPAHPDQGRGRPYAWMAS